MSNPVHCGFGGQTRAVRPVPQLIYAQYQRVQRRFTPRHPCCCPPPLVLVFSGLQVSLRGRRLC